MPETETITGDLLVPGDVIVAPSPRWVARVARVGNPAVRAVLGDSSRVVWAVAHADRALTDGDRVPPRPYTRDGVVTVLVPRPLSAVAVA